MRGTSSLGVAALTAPADAALTMPHRTISRVMFGRDMTT
jgi:hypothetical protein